MEPHDIFCLDDKQLNSYVGLRRLNPYRDDLTDYKPRPWKLKQLLSEVDYSGRRDGHQKTGDKETDEPMPMLDDEETELAERVHTVATNAGFTVSVYLFQIQQENDANVRARLASYSHETLKPYQGKKRPKPVTQPVIQSEAQDPTEGMKKSQKKNLKRKTMRQEKKQRKQTIESKGTT